MEEKRKDKSSIVELVKTVVLAIILAILIKNFVFNSTLVIGESMEPTFHQNERLICLIFPLYYSDPKEGEVVIVDAPDGSGQEYIKRVIGVPGDEIKIQNGKVFVNGVEKEEPYIHPGMETLTNGDVYWQLNEGEYFVMGDNRHEGKSVDSRFFGPVTREHINSIAFLRFYPFDKMGMIH